MYKSLRYIFWFISIFFFSFFIHQLSKYNFDLIFFLENRYQYIAYIFGAIGGLFAIVEYSSFNFMFLLDFCCYDYGSKYSMGICGINKFWNHGLYSSWRVSSCFGFSSTRKRSVASRWVKYDFECASNCFNSV